jgi:hypothetical protein
MRKRDHHTTLPSHLSPLFCQERGTKEVSSHIILPFFTPLPATSHRHCDPDRSRESKLAVDTARKQERKHAKKKKKEGAGVGKTLLCVFFAVAFATRGASLFLCLCAFFLLFLTTQPQNPSPSFLSLHSFVVAVDPQGVRRSREGAYHAVYSVLSSFLFFSLLSFSMRGVANAQRRVFPTSGR